jgi:hypothetical protein
MNCTRLITQASAATVISTTTSRHPIAAATRNPTGTRPSTSPLEIGTRPLPPGPSDPTPDPATTTTLPADTRISQTPRQSGPARGHDTTPWHRLSRANCRVMHRGFTPPTARDRASGRASCGDDRRSTAGSHRTPILTPHEDLNLRSQVTPYSHWVAGQRIRTLQGISRQIFPASQDVHDLVATSRDAVTQIGVSPVS